MCPAALRPYVHEYHPGVAIKDYPAKLASLNSDLALAPVEDNQFNRCKSNLRLLEYGACGFPVICSDVECYHYDFPVTRVKNRFKEWMEAIEMHLDDAETSYKMGMRCRRKSEQNGCWRASTFSAGQACGCPDNSENGERYARRFYLYGLTIVCKSTGPIAMFAMGPVLSPT